MSRIARRLPIGLALVLLAVGARAGVSQAAPPMPAQTRAHAQIHLLSIVARTWSARRMPGLVDPRLHVLANNSQAVCHGIGPVRPGGRFSRFLCVVRPPRHRGRAGLYVSYRARSDGSCICHWLDYRTH
jgi:hypothetical protein